MNPRRITIFIGLVGLACLSVSAQPFSLSDKIKPVELLLQDDTRQGYEGSKFLATLSTVDSAKYYYIKGHDMFRFVDIVITGFGNEEPLEAALVNTNWNDVIEQQTTATAENGIMHFMVRAYDAIGLIVRSPARKTINFTIMASASRPNKSYLGSPFVKISESEMGGAVSDVTSDSGGSGSNTLLYIALGVALLIIGVLVGKLMGRKSAAVIVVLLSFSVQASGQTATPGFFYKDRFFNGEDLDNGKFEEALEDERLGFDPSKKLDDLNKKLKSVKEFLENAKNLYSSYTNFGTCINSTPLPGAPRIPSFCAPPTTDIGFQDEKTCAGCFLQAREQFNEVRYLFEQLATIYKCTKTFSNAALSFGDNASGIHGVSGLAWQAQRRNIEKSIVELEMAYDKKYAELMTSLSESMLKLSECEARFGVEDWFDRFGYMYFEFIKDKYQRKD